MPIHPLIYAGDGRRAIRPSKILVELTLGREFGRVKRLGRVNNILLRKQIGFA